MSDITFIGDGGTGSEFHINSIKMYSDSTTMVKTEYFDRIVAECDTVMLRTSVLSSFLAGLSVVDGVRAHGGKITRLLLPYLPGARQDRANPTGDVGFMLATVANLINSYEFEQVVVVDPHSDAARKLINRMRVFPHEGLYSQLPGKYEAVIAPDAGGVHRAMRAALALGVPGIRAEKHRDPSDGKLSGFAVEVEAGKRYLVVDDICDGGGTFIGLGEKIAEQGAYGDLFVTHGIFSKHANTRRMLDLYERLYTTNTRVQESLQVQVLDVLTEMKKAAR